MGEMAPSGPRLAMCVLALGLLWAIACEGGLQELEVTSLDSEDGCSGERPCSLRTSGKQLGESAQRGGTVEKTKAKAQTTQEIAQKTAADATVAAKVELGENRRGRNRNKRGRGRRQSIRRRRRPRRMVRGRRPRKRNRGKRARKKGKSAKKKMKKAPSQLQEQTLDAGKNQTKVQQTGAKIAADAAIAAKVETQAKKELQIAKAKATQITEQKAQKAQKPNATKSDPKATDSKQAVLEAKTEVEMAAQKKTAATQTLKALLQKQTEHNRAVESAKVAANLAKQAKEKRENADPDIKKKARQGVKKAVRSLVKVQADLTAAEKQQADAEGSVASVLPTMKKAGASALRTGEEVKIAADRLKQAKALVNQLTKEAKARGGDLAQHTNKAKLEIEKNNRVKLKKKLLLQKKKE